MALVAICISGIGIYMTTWTSSAWDMLETIYEKSKFYDYNVNIGTDRDSVGKGILRWSYTVTVGKGSGGWLSVQWNSSDPILIRVVKWFLEIVVILWVPLLIVTWIKYIMASGSDADQAKARKFGINVVIGIIVALGSLAMVTLIWSLLNDTKLWWI